MMKLFQAALAASAIFIAVNARSQPSSSSPSGQSDEEFSNKLDEMRSAISNNQQFAYMRGLQDGQQLGANIAYVLGVIVHGDDISYYPNSLTMREAVSNAWIKISAGEDFNDWLDLEKFRAREEARVQTLPPPMVTTNALALWQLNTNFTITTNGEFGSNDPGLTNLPSPNLNMVSNNWQTNLAVNFNSVAFTNNHNVDFNFLGGITLNTVDAIVTNVMLDASYPGTISVDGTNYWTVKEIQDAMRAIQEQREQYLRMIQVSMPPGQPWTNHGFAVSTGHVLTFNPEITTNWIGCPWYIVNVLIGLRSDGLVIWRTNNMIH